MTLYDFMGNHPIVTLLIVVAICATLSDIFRYIFQRKA